MEDEKTMTGGEGERFLGVPPYHSGSQVPPERGGLSRRGWIIAIVATAVLVAALFVAGFLVDRLLFQQKKTSGRTFGLSDSSSYEDALFNIRNYFYRDYSEREITAAAEKAVDIAKKKGVRDPDKLEEIGLKALLKALDDKHSQYLTEEENRRLSEDISGSFFGVGFMLREENKRPKVYSVIKDSPSDRAGVRKDDVILFVDGRSTREVNLDVVVSWIRGRKGTSVELKIRRKGVEETLTFKITREKIEIPDIKYEVMDGKYGYIQVSGFNKGAGVKVRDGVRELVGKGVEGFILDFRNDPGGLLDEAVKISRVFVNDGTIVSYQTKGEKKVDEKADGSAETDLPVVVLINGGSASSSEIVAGAMKDLNRAVLVGSRTYGKGSVQKIYELPNGGAAKLTIALYYLPNGESIDGKGIEPDIRVEYRDDLEKEDRMQLDKAKEVLERLIRGETAAFGELRPAA